MVSKPESLREAHRRQLQLLDECLAAIAAHSALIERTGAVSLTTTTNARALAIAGAISYVFEISKSCAVLIRARRLAASYALSRTVLVGLADLIGLQRDSAYALHMDATRIGEWQRLFRLHEQSPNPLLVEARIDRLAEGQDLREQLAETSAAGGSALHDAERLSRADMHDERGSVYWLWSLYAHANLAAIWNVHAYDDADGKRRFRFHADPDPIDIATVTDSLIGMLLQAAFIAFDLLQLPSEPLIALRGELAALRRTIGFHEEVQP
jgi:hypothetical protein